jgi:hypothetical protein
LGIRRCRDCPHPQHASEEKGGDPTHGTKQNDS